MLFDASRPILLNGIEDVISRPDLGDHAIFLTLAPIADGDRRPERDLWREFEIARPLILGALLDAVVHGLRAINQVQLEALPRMADFALWAAACETALWPAGTFACAYAANRRAAALEAAMGEKPAGTRRSPAACPNVPSHAGHRDWLWSRRTIRRANDQNERPRAGQAQQWCRNAGGRAKRWISF